MRDAALSDREARHDERAREGASTETMVEKVDRAMFVRYAGASGDFNPIHWNEDFAKSAGYPGVFAQGMFTAGVLGTFLTNWVGRGKRPAASGRASSARSGRASRSSARAR